MSDEDNRRPRPPKPKEPEKGRGDIVVSIAECEPDDGNGTELATWTGDLLLGMADDEAVELATDILLAARNAKGDVVQVWLPASTVRIYKPE